MIVDILITILNFFIRLFISIVPNWSLPDAINTALVYFGVYVNKAAFLFPIADLFVILGIVLTFEMFLFMIRILSGILGFIRGSGKIDI